MSFLIFKNEAYILFTYRFDFLSSCGETESPQKDKKPLNIVYIMADDLAYQAISAYGSEISKLAPTPNIDRIANEGARMDAVYCTNSICGPSRASILTGKFSHVNGFYKNVDGGTLMVSN